MNEIDLSLKPETLIDQPDTIGVSVGATAPTDAPDRRIRVMLVVSGLGHGGAERQVVQLANHLDRRRFDVTVCSLSQKNPLADGLDDPQSLVVVEKRWRFDYGTVARLADELRRRRIDVAHAFLFDADIAARIAGRKAKTPVVISSERNADYNRPRLHTMFFKLTNRRFDAMIANSHAGKRFNVRTLGIHPRRIFVVPNGVDVTRFKPEAARSLRTELNIPADAHVVGMVASFKPQKNHPMFARMAQRLLEQTPDVRFILAGGTLDAEGTSASSAMRSNARMHKASSKYFVDVRRLLEPLEARGRLIMLGNRSDMPRVYNACDLTVLTSHHEGTSNVLLESMACGVPAIATDVADNRRIIPDDRIGCVVPPGDDEAMALRVRELLADCARRREMSAACRAWVEQEFANEALARRTGDLYTHLLAGKRR